MLTTGQEPRLSRGWIKAILVALLLAALLVRGNRVATPAAGTLATVLVAVSCALVLRAWARTGSLMNGYTLVLATFLMAYPISAFVHLTGADYKSQGFYDLAALDVHTQLHHVYLSLALVFLAQFGLWFGLAPGYRVSEPAAQHMVRVRSKLLILAGLVFSLVGAVSTFVLFSKQGGSVEDIAIDRARGLESGSARYAFMSSWLTWGIIFLLCAFLASQASKNHARLTLSTLLAGSGCMMLNMLWTGERAENLLALLPLIFMVRKFARHVFRPFIATAAFAVAGIIVFETIWRTSGLLTAGAAYLTQSGMTWGQFAANQLCGVLDWQMGRYPTIALSFDMVKHSGYAFGSTLLQGVAMTVNAPATLLHIPAKVSEPEAVTAMVGQYLLGDSTINGVVPGTLAELYLNFGVCGVLGGFFVIGLMARYCIGITRSAGDTGTLLLGFYGLVLICIWTIPMTATLPLYFLATKGFPILVLWTAERMLGQVRSPGVRA